MFSTIQNPVNESAPSSRGVISWNGCCAFARGDPPDAPPSLLERPPSPDVTDEPTDFIKACASGPMAVTVLGKLRSDEPDWAILPRFWAPGTRLLTEPAFCKRAVPDRMVLDALERPPPSSNWSDSLSIPPR